MPEIISLSAEPRPRSGKGAARATRRGGRVPGIVYGGDKEPVPISLEPRELARVLARPGVFATLVDISVDGTMHRTLPRDRKSTRLNSSHIQKSRMPSSA